MKLTTRLLTLVFAMVFLTGLGAVSASAQRRGGGRIIYRPVVVRPYFGYHRYWGWNRWNDPYLYDPYLREREQKYYLEQELNGNKRELQKHLEKYNADGVITAKEQKELNDDYRDVERAERNLNKFNSED